MNVDTAQLEQLGLIVRRAACRADARTAVALLYSDVQREIEARRPVCSVSGRCCRFEEFGHRLFVTTLELASFVHELAARPAVRPATAEDASLNHSGRAGLSLPLIAHVPDPSTTAVPFSGAGCPFQVGGLCDAHPFRPFGCRMFFCDATAAEWQNQAYERFHAELKRLHESLGVPYFYIEWRAALRALDLVGPSDL